MKIRNYTVYYVQPVFSQNDSGEDRNRPQKTKYIKSKMSRKTQKTIGKLTDWTNDLIIYLRKRRNVEKKYQKNLFVDGKIFSNSATAKDVLM